MKMISENKESVIVGSGPTTAGPSTEIITIDRLSKFDFKLGRQQDFSGPFSAFYEDQILQVEFGPFP